MKTKLQKRFGKLSLRFDEAGTTGLGQSQRVRDESGAVLILALMFLVVIGLVVGGLTSWTSNDLGSTLTFQQQRSSQYALSSATQVAIQSIRYTPLLGSGQTVNASPPTYCWGTAAGSDPTYGGSELTTQNDPVNVYCSTVWNPTSAQTRVVTISACLQSALQAAVPTPATPAAFATYCAQSSGLQTIVTFDDYSPANPVITPGPCLTTCGYGMTISSSHSHSTVPTVSGLSSSNGPAVPVAGQNVLTVTGSGFVSGSTTTVNFVSTSASLNLSLAGTDVSVTSSTSLNVTIPAATTVTAYYVIVTTTSGSSPPSSASTYTYNPVIPTISGIANTSGGTSGSSAGGTALIITGTGFLSNLSGDSTVVNFTDAAPGSTNAPLQACAQPGSAGTPNCTSYLTVNSSTQITVTTPADPYTDLTFNVTVTTAPGGPSAAAPQQFTYIAFTPLIASVSPNSGAGPLSVTLTGIGFVTGATTVTLVPTTGNYATLTATNVSVTNSTALTATVPTGGHNNVVYDVEVTTPGGNSGTGGAANQYTY